MKNLLSIVFLTLVLFICVILELLQKIVIWDSTPLHNIRETFKDYIESVKILFKKVDWMNVFHYLCFTTLSFSIYYYIIDKSGKMVLMCFLFGVSILWSLLMELGEINPVGHKKSFNMFIWILICIALLFLSSCSKGQCPTTDKKFFYRGVPKSKPLYTGYRSQKGYIVPYKYTRKIPNYGKIK